MICLGGCDCNEVEIGSGAKSDYSLRLIHDAYLSGLAWERPGEDPAVPVCREKGTLHNVRNAP